MVGMKRLYEDLVAEHFRDDRQMLFLMGPRQVGKTTTARQSGSMLGELHYLNWDNLEHRRPILAGPGAVAKQMRLEQLRSTLPTCVFDEIHKYGRWKSFLKGFFDTYADAVHVLVTGSARLDVFKAGGDSLMGRYFGYRMHPLSIAELVSARPQQTPIDRQPRAPDDDQWAALLAFGGYPEPFLKQNKRFWLRWRRLRSQLLFKEDLRDLTRIQELGQVEMLAELLRQRIGQLVSYASLSTQIGASIDSIKRWIEVLEALYYCFAVRPWFTNVARALRKEPKYFLWDWSIAPDKGAVAENFVASALLKAVHFWTDHGDGVFDLRFIRDKEKREVDFVVVRNNAPWFIVEVKSSAKASLSPHLARFQAQTGAQHAFQVAMDLPFVDRDCFEIVKPMVVPARTFLAQLV